VQLFLKRTAEQTRELLTKV